MDKKRLYRLEVTPDAYNIIEAESFLSGRTLKSIASEILTSHSSKKALNLAASKLEGVKIKEPKEHRDEKPKDHMIIEPKCGASDVVNIPQTRPKLVDNEAALSRMKEMWTSTPRPSFGKIARDVNYPKKTVEFRIKKMIESGDLMK